MSKINPAQLFKAMRAKVVGCLKIEAKMTIKEREQQQWQLLFQIKGHGDYIVGKGGANTMFWIKNNGERHTCYPQQMLELLDKWCASSESTKYHIVYSKKSVASYDSLDEARTHKAKEGSKIVKVEKGEKTALFVRKQGLMGIAWKPTKS